MKTTHYVYFFALLFVGIYVSAYDMYVSALPLLRHDFHVDVAQSQLTLTIFVIAGAFFSIPAGIIDDKLGHKNTISVFTALIIIGTLLCQFAPSIYFFYAGRILQGMAASGFYILAVSIPKDLLSGTEFVKAWQSLTLMFYIAPSVAGFVGGYIVYYGGWQWVFNIVILLSLITLVCVLLLFHQDASHTNNHKKQPSFKRLWHVISNTKFLSYCYITAAAWGGMSVFYICTPYVVINTLGYSTIVYGWLSFLLVISGAVGRWINMRWISHRLSYENNALIFAWIAILSGILFLFTGLNHSFLSIYLMSFASIIFGFSSAIVSVNASTIALIIFDKTYTAAVSAIYSLMVDFIVAASLVAANLIFANLFTLSGIVLFFYITTVILITKYKQPARV
ncbi:MFS transporter [Facilibium subflavum]|uniref:MFS transporter n=1 Tax=Facilibium subflavum TaxID=2219058 RepID=UPI000E6563FD|nr:MFS transporter [Facilibium subflavum]